MCKQCETKPVYEFTNQRKLCKTCFVRWFQKKVLYTIRRFELIKSGEVVGYKFEGSFRDVVLEDVLKMFAEKSMVELIKLPTTKKLSKIAIASTTDLEADKIVHALINGGKLSSAVDGKMIKPLYLFLDKEVLLYAKLRNLRFKKTEEGTQDKISEFIDGLEKKHPEVKQAVVSGLLKINV